MELNGFGTKFRKGASNPGELVRFQQAAWNSPQTKIYTPQR
jgi:hypothetical protein